MARQAGASIGVADSQLLLALVELVSGDATAARALLDQVSAIYSATESHYYLATTQLYRAAAGLLLGDDAAVEDGLRHFLGFARHEQLLTCAWWTPDLVEPLLLAALRAHAAGAEQHDDITLIVVRVLGGAVG